jgi:hypothetical protein
LLTSSPIGRRARTLSARTAVEETSELAAAYIRAGGSSSAGASADRAGHGIKTLSEVIDEAEDLTRADLVLKRKQQIAQGIVLRGLKRIGDALSAKTSPIHSDVHDLQATSLLIKNTYVTDAFGLVRDILNDSPRRLQDVECVCQTLISDLRARGFTDPTLIEMLDGALKIGGGDGSKALAELERLTTVTSSSWRCYVSAHISPIQRYIDRLPNLELAPLPTEATGRPAAGSTHLLLTVQSVDRRSAAASAKARIESILGTAAVFVGQPLASSPVVTVQVGSAFESIDTNESLEREYRGTSRLEEMLLSSWERTAATASDAILDAIRHHERAMSTYDLENRFMLLWFGIERLVAGTPDHSTILSSARHIVPPSLTLAKVRRDISSLASALVRRAKRNLPQQMKRKLLDLLRPQGAARSEHSTLARFLIGPEDAARDLLSTFYDVDPRLVIWFKRLRDCLAGGSGKAIARYLEDSRQRVEWQIIRLYRARTSLAHATGGPSWLRDLIVHAHHYVTQLIAIVLHYQRSAPRTPPAEILFRRSRQYSIFIDLLRKEDPRATGIDAILDPARFLSGP